ncbi:hypothetical protein VP01_7971g1, partial [Puccinia sorghi]
GGGGVKDEGVVVKALTNSQIKCCAYKAKFQKERQLNANMNLSGVEHLPSFIFWADQSLKKIIAIVKFYPLSTMDPSLKSRYQRLSQHLMAQSINLSESQPKQILKRSQMDITSSKAIFLNKTPSLANCSTQLPVLYVMKSRRNTMPLKHLDWKPNSKKILMVLLAIYPSLSPTLPKKNHKDNDASPTFVMGVNWSFPCGINFLGFNGILECAWKATVLR